MAVQNLKRKIQLQNMIILALAIVIIVLVAVSSTAAWYIRTKSDSADIILSNPVNIYIAEFDDNGKYTLVTDILEPYRNRIYPGDRIKLNLGMQIGTEDEKSSSAYVRVKLSMAFSKISDDPNEPIITLEDMANQKLIEYEKEPNTNNWELVDFNEYSQVPEGEEYVPDYWYVFKTTEAGGDVARVAQNLEQIEFLNGYIKLSKTEITNKYANCKFHINYTVEAIQIVNVPDPLKFRGYGPWWNFAYGDIEDTGSI
ncbi:MAG: hypothetical protein ACI4PF_00160 [Christensenellales bacterium]